jgi:hypothetical protein
MTKTLLATTAAVALIAGMSLAAAQGTKEGAPGAAGATQGQPQAQPQKQGGTEKGSRTGQSGAGAEHNKMGQGAGEKNERTGQKSEEKGERTGQKAGEKNERTGQKSEEKNERMGQKPGEKNERTGQKTEEKNERTGQKAGEKNERTGQGAQQPGGASTAERSGGGKSVTLSSEQKTRIKEVIGHNRTARVEHLDFSLSVGTRVPRTVHVLVLPEDIVRIVPEYRGYKYIIVRDEIVILDPDTLEIVAILPA